MSLPREIQSIPGSQELYDWFGYWPRFHDAEILKFDLELGKPALLQILTWEMTSRVDERGFYEQVKHIVVDFFLEEVSKFDLVDFLEGSILFDLNVEKIDYGYRVIFSSSYGLAGTIEAVKLSLRLIPGNPKAGSAI